MSGKRRNANAYAASSDVAMAPTVMASETIDAVHQVPAEVALRPRVAQRVEREVDGQQRARVVEDGVAGLQGAITVT